MVLISCTRTRITEGQAVRKVSRIVLARPGLVFEQF